MLNKIAGAVAQVAEAGGSIVGIRSGTEEPAYTVVREIDGVEIRRYGPRIAAETAVATDEEAARNEGFRRLARYIFGANSGKDKIAMTAPVAQQQSEKIAMTAPVATQRGSADDWVIRFFMPSKYTMDTLPSPKDDRVRLVEVPGETVAVLRYNGSYSPEAVAARTTAAVGNVEPQQHRGGGRSAVVVLRPAVDGAVPPAQRSRGRRGRGFVTS